MIKGQADLNEKSPHFPFRNIELQWGRAHSPQIITEISFVTVLHYYAEFCSRDKGINILDDIRVFRDCFKYDHFLLIASATCSLTIIAIPYFTLFNDTGEVI